MKYWFNEALNSTKSLSQVAVHQKFLVFSLMLSEAAYFTAQSEIFSTANWPKTSPNLIFSSIKMNIRRTYI